MSIEVPENMEEVAMTIARAGVHGQKLSTDEVITSAVKDILQAYMDEALAGHYDDVKWDGNDLIVCDLGKEVGRVKPVSDSFINDFKTDAVALSKRMAQEASRIVGGR